MKMLIFDAKRYDRHSFEGANSRHGHELHFAEPRLTPETAVLAHGYPAVCAFVNDQVNAETLRILAEGKTRLMALRSAGFNHVDLAAARELNIAVVRVPEYSPYAVAEHAVAMILALNRQIPRAFNRVRDGNFSLDGLVGFDLHGRTVGVVGTGKIGGVFARIMHGFGCRLLAYDPHPNEPLRTETGLEYVSLDRLYEESDIISLHLPLLPTTRHLINGEALAKMKPTVMLVNTGRGLLIDTKALIAALKEKRVGGACLDVYEEEEGIFFQDLSGEVLRDDVLARLLTFPNVLVTSHQGFLTREALGNIAETTLASLTAFERGEELVNRVALP